MDKLSAFDMVGPVMIGPSSSHTAGAVRIGNLAKEIVNNEYQEIKIYFHGSFKETYRGHGTDKAIIGGLLGYKTDDERIRNSLTTAEEKGIKFEFFPIKLENVHPNTVKLEITDVDGVKTTITASSVGGGKIVVTRLNNTEVNLKGEYYTLITFHQDQPGLIAKISEILNIYDLNIAEMQVLREKKGHQATAIINLDHAIEDQILSLIRSIPGIKTSKLIKPLI